MTITQISVSAFPLTFPPNDAVIRPASGEASDSDEQRRREARRNASQLSPRMRQAQQEKQAQRLSTMMLNELTPALRSPSSLLSSRSLSSTMNDLLEKSSAAPDENALLQAEGKSANARHHHQVAADSQTFKNRGHVADHTSPEKRLLNDALVSAENERAAAGKKRLVDKLPVDKLPVDKLPHEKRPPFDVAAQLADLGSMQGKGKAGLALRQMTDQLKSMADALAAFKNGGAELTGEEFDQLAYSADFLEGYAEASQMDPQTRAQFDASLQSLRAHLDPVIQASVAEALVANGDTLGGLANLASTSTAKQRTARASNAISAKEDGKTPAFAGVERSRRALLAQDDAKKQSEDTLPLIVQRSV